MNEVVDFLPVLLGSDVNAYGMARDFHQTYGVKSVAVCKHQLSATADTGLIHFEFEPDLENPEKFIQKLNEVADKYTGKKLVLVPCADGYIKLMIRFQEQLREKYCFNCISESLLQALQLKENFYKICDKYGFVYPKTIVLSKETWKSAKLPFDFPVVIKASNSVEYWKCSFPGKLKVFIAQDRAEFERIFTAIYKSSYQDHMTVQEYIPGDDSHMRVLNCYVGTDHKVKLMSLGQALLEEHTPEGIGSYAAVINTFDKALLDKIQYFLEDIGYSGFANFDMKYDDRNGEYKLFEINIRQGRSSFFTTGSGYSLGKWLVDDVVYHKPMELTYATNECLWTMIPMGVIKKYCQNKELIEKAVRLKKEGKWCNSLYYKPDLNIKRRLRINLYSLNHFRKFKKYFGNKGLAQDAGK